MLKFNYIKELRVLISKIQEELQELKNKSQLLDPKNFLEENKWKMCESGKFDWE